MNKISNALTLLITLVVSVLACTVLMASATSAASAARAAGADIQQTLPVDSLGPGQHLRVGPMTGYFAISMKASGALRVVARDRCDGFDDVSSLSISSVYNGIVHIDEGCVYFINPGAAETTFKHEIKEMSLMLVKTAVARTIIISTIAAVVVSAMSLFAFVMTDADSRSEKK